MRNTTIDVERMRYIFKAFTIGLLTSISCVGQGNIAEKLKQPISDLPRTDLRSVKMSQDTITKLIELIKSNPSNDFRGMVVEGSLL